VDFTTFLQQVPQRFDPQLNGEHTAFAWGSVDTPPEPLHPGVNIALARVRMTELDVATAIRAGELVSPQRYENVWLFALRITGTGTAYRQKLEEYVYRAPGNYLTPEFLARCNGLPVVWEHPEAGKLDSTEFANRVIGAILLPYIQGDEIWGIAKIYDDDAAHRMTSRQLSTSPGVVFRPLDGNQTAQLEDGRTLLVEGKPSLLDHLAICEEGVWDKGGPPAGVDLPTSIETSGDMNMAEIEKEVDGAEKRSDAQEGGNIDKLLTAIDALCDRMGGFEKRMDSMDAKYGAARKDASENVDEKLAEVKADDDDEETADDAAEVVEEKEVETEKAPDLMADSSRKDSAPRHSGIENHLYREVNRLKDVVASMPMRQTRDDYAAMAEYQARADSIYGECGERPPAPLEGETAPPHRIRLAKGVQQHSTAWKDTPLRDLPPNALAIAENAIYADAQSAARSPASVGLGMLR